MVKYKLLFVLLFISLNLQAQNLLQNFKTGEVATVQQISVTVSGDFPVNGTFSASITERFDEFITRLIETEKQSFRASTQPWQANNLKYSTRNIKLIRDGKTSIIDLHKFRMTGDMSNNPFLKNNDVIVFPKNDLDYNYISVEGAVNKPGKFMYVKGDKLEDAINLSLGFSEFLEVKEILIYRFNQIQPIKLSPKDLSFELQPADRILVQADFNSRKDRRVLVIGEVNNPGYIPIKYDNNNLHQIIQSAGGFRSKVDSMNIELLKNSPIFYNYQTKVDLNFEQLYLNEFKIQQLKSQIEALELERMAYLYPEDTSGFSNDLKLKIQKSSFLFTQEEINGDTIINKIEDGDVIIVNPKPDNVYLFGQTGFVGNIKYSPNKPVSYYLDIAEGLGDYARKDEIYLISYKTKKWTNVTKTLTSTIVEAGDYIWVPKEPRHELTYYTQRISAIAQIVSALATTIIAVVAVFRK